MQKEIGFTASVNKRKTETVKHFITEDVTETIYYGEGMTMIYPCAPKTQVLDVVNGSCTLTAHSYGMGKAVYMAGLPYNDLNTRILLRSIYWSAGKAELLYKWFSTNSVTECNAYPEAGKFCLINNSDSEQTTEVYLGDGGKKSYTLKPMEMRWLMV